MRRGRRPLRRPIGRPMRPLRRAVRVARRRRRRIRRTRRFLFGTAVVLAVAGSLNNYKMNQDDLSKLEQHYQKPAEELTEAELLQGMRKLGIKHLELDEDEENAIVDEIGEE